MFTGVSVSLLIRFLVFVRFFFLSGLTSDPLSSTDSAGGHTGPVGRAEEGSMKGVSDSTF